MNAEGYMPPLPLIFLGILIALIHDCIPKQVITYRVIPGGLNSVYLIKAPAQNSVLHNGHGKIKCQLILLLTYAVN